MKRAAQQRIVSLAPSATSILCAIGARKTLVGVSKWCADVADVGHLPKFGDCWHMKDAAAIHALKPDLVIGSVPFRAEALIKLLAEPVNFLALNPKTLSDIERDILQLGAITDRPSAAGKLIKKMRAGFAALAKRARKQQRVRVYAEAWPNPRIASPPWVAEVVRFAGGEMVTAAGARVSEEEVATANPELIVLAWAATGKKAKPSRAYGVAAWKNVNAIRNRNVFAVRDELLNTPGPPLLAGAKELARIFAECRGKNARP